MITDKDIELEIIELLDLAKSIKNRIAGFASKDHKHDEYAPKEHVHEGYAASTHHGDGCRQCRNRYHHRLAVGS